MRSPFLFLITRLVQASLISLLLLLGNLSAQAQTIRYVKPVATGTGTGDSWANASSDLQAMITASAANQQVWVAAGTYRPGGNANTDRTISFAMRNGVAIYGGFVGNETDLSQRPAINPISGNPSSSTLSGDLLGDDGPNAANNGDNSYNVISNNNNGLNATAVLDGFVITGGNATNGRGTGFAGGGMINLSSSPTITNCSFISNVSDDSSVAYGGAMHNSNSSPTITNCSFQNNRATGLFGTGGAIYNGGSSSPTITNCSFTGNQARGGGGAIASEVPSPTITNCSFQSNTAANGGAIFNNAGSSPTITNCSFQSNSATNLGGAIFNNNSSSPTLTNSVLWGNGGGNTVFNGTNSSSTATYSLFDQSVTGYSTGPTNLTTTTSPFASPTSVSLATGSPAINAGNNNAPGLAGITTDLAGNPRIVGCVVDMGAVEFQAGATPGLVTWTGCTSRDWNTAGNWASSNVPTATSDVVIPSGPANQPILSTTAVAFSVEVQSGASLSISSAGSLTINGSKTLGGFTNALFSGGTVTNDGQIVIDITASTSQFGLWNRGTFTNTGRISIDRTTAQALRNPSGTAATFINSGTITIGGSATVNDNGILNQATFQNNAGGLITIDQVTASTGAAIFNGGASGSFINSATITIGASVSVGGNGITNQASFTNTTGGDISINRASVRGITNFATFINSATLTIGNIDFSAADGIQNQGTFTNNATGEIRADRAPGNAVRNVAGTFGNDGKIVIGSVANTGVGILNTGTSFSNTAGASIQLDRVTRGLTNASAFFNAGQIKMGNNVPLGERGLLNGNGTGTVAAVFNNLPGGLLQIDQTAANQDGITNELLTTFNNGGTVSIGMSGSIGGNAIANAGTFSNGACATLNIGDNLLNTNSLTNVGFFTVSTTQPHSNNGTLTNNGVISYPQGNPIPNVTNNALVVNSFSVCGTTSATALQIGGANSFSAGSTWYTDAGLTTPAGTYDQNTNTFTPTNLSAPGSLPLYFTATDNTNACTRTVSVSATLNVPPSLTVTANPSLTITNGQTVTLTASGASSYTWTGGSTGSSFTATPASDTPYSVTGASTAGCRSNTSVTVTVNAPLCYSVVYVTQSGAGLQNGSSWANAYPGTMLQTAINSATSCSGEVWVAAGIYRPTTSTDRTISFQMRNNVRIYGGFAGNETSLSSRPLTSPNAGNPSSTTLSGEIGDPTSTTDNSFHVFYHPNGSNLNNTALLDGFVITGGNADATSGDNAGGGGMHFRSSSSVRVNNCLFELNTTASGNINFGGAILSVFSSLQLTNCLFRNNQAFSGGAICQDGSSSSLTLVNCSFQNNNAPSGLGGAININAGTLFSYNTSFIGNQCRFNGGAIWTTNTITLVNNSFQNNRAGAFAFGGAIYANGSAGFLTNCVFFGNGGSNTFFGGTRTASYSLFDNTTGVDVTGPGNLTTITSPFVSTASVALNACAPAIDAGDPSSATAATGPFSVTALPQTDLAGNPRIFGGRVDMGAVEFQDAPAAFTVTVSASPGLTITSGQTVTLTATGGTSYTWTDGTTGSSFTATPGVGSTTYSVTGVNAAGCTSTTSVTVTVNPAPTLAGFAPTAATVCVGSVATFTATVGDVTGAYNFTLTNGTGPVSGTATGASFSQTLTASGSGQQTFTLTIGANGTTVASSTTLSVQALPTAGINLPTNLTLTCASPTVSISATGGGTYRWDDNSTTASRSLTASGTYSVTVTSAGGCSSTASQLVTLTLNNTAPSLALSSTNVCAGNVVNLSATAGLTSYTFVGGSGVISTGTSNTVAVSELSTASYSFTVLAAGPNGCTATATTSLTVLPRPAAPALSSQSRSLTASPTPVSLTGFVEATGNALSFSGVTGLLDPPTANISTAGVQNFSVSQTNANGCISPVTLFSLTVTAPVVVTPASQTVCRGSQVVLTAGTTGTRYEWYRGGQLPANRLINVVGVQVGTGTASLTLVSVQTTATYFCKIFAANGSFTWAGPFAVVVNAGCVAPGGRVAAQLETPLRVIIAPNPVEGGWLRAVVTGAGGQRLRAQLTDLNGQVLREQQWEQADTKHLIEWDMQARPGGVYLLQIGTDGQHTTLKLIKP